MDRTPMIRNDRKRSAAIWVLAIAAIALLLTAISPLKPATAADVEQPEQSVWLLNTRSITPRKTTALDDARISYHKMNAEGQWEKSDWTAFHEENNTQVPTIVFIHGNLFSQCDVIRGAMPVYTKLKSAAPDKPFRFVIWSWPSDMIVPDPLIDVSMKARRADAESSLLANWLLALPHGGRVSLLGHSLGSRMIIRALSKIDADDNSKMTDSDSQVTASKAPSDSSPEGPSHYRAVLTAAAIEHSAMRDPDTDGTDPRMEMVLVTRNFHDPALKLYPAIEGPGGRQALGTVGPSQTDLFGASKTVDVSSSLGATHDMDLYFRTKTISSDLPKYTFLNDE